MFLFSEGGKNIYLSIFLKALSYCTYILEFLIWQYLKLSLVLTLDKFIHVNLSSSKDKNTHLLHSGMLRDL